MNKLCYLIIILFTCRICDAQKYDCVWVFGDSAGINFNNLSNPNSFPSVLYSTLDENFASIADKNGNLQFYIAGLGGPGGLASYSYSQIWNSSFQLMANGDSIPSDRSCTQGTLIIPSLTDTNQYCLFYLNRSVAAYPLGLYYSIIDMSLNGGLGAVISKNNLIRAFYAPTEKLTAVKHGNGRDWWIVTHGFGINDAFYKYLLTPYGIDSIPAQNIGSVYSGINGTGIQGQMVFSPQGTKLACAGTGSNQDGILDLFDFDRCTGIISNWINLNDSLFYFYGCSFSPNGNVLYASTIYSQSRNLYQFDLTASNILASKLLLFTGHPGYPIAGHQIGPDNKIYITSEYHTQPDTFFTIYNRNLTVINNPDVYGTGCNLSPYSFYLGGRKTRCSLPNMANYRLGVDEGSPCDTILSINNSTFASESIIEIFPNPAIDRLNVTSNHNVFFEITLYDFASRKIFNQSFINSTSINTEQLAKGIYLYEVRNKNGVIKKGKVVKD